MLLETIDFIIKKFFSAKIPLTSTLSQPKKSAIRVGSDYQVLTLPEPKGRGEEVNRDLCLWKMHQMIKDEQLSNYCINAFTNFGIEPDRVFFEKNI